MYKMDESPLFKALRHKIAVRDTFSYASYDGYENAVLIKNRNPNLELIISIKKCEENSGSTKLYTLEYADRYVSKLVFMPKTLKEVLDSPLADLLNEKNEIIMGYKSRSEITDIYNWILRKH